VVIAQAEVAPEIVTSPTIGLFQIVSINFKEGNKWKFNSGHGDFWAEVSDDGFLSKVHRREVLFGEGDVLRAEYVTKAWRKPGKIESETTITRVLEVILPEPSGSQSRLL
jgi:hypothetical protein